jgi:hypothetical protein
LRVRGYTKPCYNVLEFDDAGVRIWRKFPFGERQLMTHFTLATHTQLHREHEPHVQDQDRAVPVPD